MTASPYQLCDDLKSRIDRYIMPGEDVVQFYRGLCSQIRPSLIHSGRDMQTYSLLFETVKAPQISLEDVKNIHRKFFSESENAGKLRNKRIFLGSNRYPLPVPEVIEPLMEGVIRSFNAGVAGRHPIRVAAAIHHKITFIYPFSTGTFEVAQFMQNLVLLRYGYPPVVIPEEKLPKYNSLLDAGRMALDAFADFIAGCVAEMQQSLLNILESSGRRTAAESSGSENPQPEKTENPDRVFFVEGCGASVNPVYAKIAERPGIRKTEIAGALDMSPRDVARVLSELKKTGMIDFKGQPKTGGYFPTSARPLDSFDSARK